MSSLRGNRSFWGLTVTQFLGAFNDNAFKQFIVLLALSESVKRVVAEQFPYFGSDLQPVTMIVFSVPFVLFALLAGAFADRYSKRRVIVAMKVVELIIMGLGFATFFIWSRSPESAIWLALATLGLMGTQSAFFGPAKYGAIPELVDNKLMTRANGVISATTWSAIILGTLLAGELNTFVVDRGLPVYNAAYVFLLLSLIGVGASLLMHKLPASDPSRKLPWNLAAVPAHAVREWKFLARDRDLLIAVLGVSLFTCLGAFAMQALNKYGQDALGMETRAGTGLMWPLAVGVGLGSLLASRLSGERIEFGLVPVGAVGLACGFGALYFIPAEYWIACAVLTVTGVFGGLYVVPQTTFTQQRPASNEKGRVLGMGEMLGFVGVAISALLYHLCVNVLGFTAGQSMLALALLTLVSTLGLGALSPRYLVRSFLWFLTHTLYRIKRVGTENVPSEGGVLLVSNHVSFVDPFLVGASLNRMVRFLMHRSFLDVPVVGTFSRLMKVIPVADTDGPRELLKSLTMAGEHVAEGHVACIFAEGGITRTGNLLPFSKGLERIARGGKVPIVPVYIDQMWGSIFSFRGGKFFFKRPVSLPYPVSVSFGKALPYDTPSHQVRQAVQELAVAAFDRRKKRGETLATRFLRVAKRNARRPAVYDHTQQELSYRQLLVAILVFREILRPRVGDAVHVGIVLPPCNAATIANLAMTFSAKVPVNLNFTVGEESFESAIDQCGIQTIITSRSFLEKAKLKEDARHIYFEDLLTEVNSWKKGRAYLKTLLPSSLLIRLLRLPRNPDDLATIIFSSGSTGVPKGVCLTHHNILSNTRGLGQVFDVRSDDRIIGVLPFFHSFGYTVALWFPMLNGIQALYHTSPIDAQVVADLIREKKGTIFFSTPTFYLSYLRRFKPEDFESVRIAGSGAEKLKESLGKAWKKRFGQDIMEGYGCTELSPVVSINLPDVELPDAKQVARKPGTIGHPLPGIAAKVVDPDTFEPRPLGDEGLLLIAGPNVMSGYLKRPDLTEEVIRDGWYVTGDIGRLDADGFVTITDRLSRFSKIGGEMVPHVKVEEAILTAFHDLGANSGEHPADAAVTSLPDEKRGEKLVVLHTPLNVEVSEVISTLRSGELPNLWIPRADAFLQVDEIPKLGSGKLDLKEIRSMAEEMLKPAGG